MDLLFATNNPHKIKEIKAALGVRYDIVSLQDFNIYEDIPEDHDTLEANALAKARYVFDKVNIPVFADDTGLEVESLGNRPGVLSARYAGSGCDFDDNMDLLLREMSGKINRKARFRTIIALILDNKEYLFEGIINGNITIEKYGKGGFGYDPVLKPDNFDQTFAEMNIEEKNRISHRAIATRKLISFLQDR